MVDDELDLVRELFAADDTPLDPATGDRIRDRIAAGLVAAADEERSSSKGPAPPHRSGRRRRLVFAVGGMVATAAVVLAVLLPSDGGDSRPGRPSAVAPHHARTIHFQVTGYTQAQATAAATQCLSAAGAAGEKGAALRATFSDASGSTLVVTTPSGWYTCEESADGSTLVPEPYETYAQAQGGGLNAVPADDLSAHWLIGPVEVDSDGGGYLSKSTLANGWLDIALGRVAPNIAKVTIQMPGGSMITAVVENGFFVARQLLPSMPAFSESGTIPIMGYDSSGTLVYDSLTSPFAMPTHPSSTWQPPCVRTPNGQPIRPNTPSDLKCQTVIAWGS
jgi:hypothetical protein